ncbi:MAG TPA: SusD/RagB family nutrient-binding outer membrane lipoprotein [Spirosoma sp.]|nr:SusD/RagB family nutrient-binding outer membrane lipoprotein [Spirosoma sp.]
MKNKFYFTFFLLLLVFGCTDDFERINQNTNAPTETNVGSLLPSIIFEPINPHMLLEAWLTDQVMQYVVRRNDNQLDAYDFATGQTFFGNVWRTNYAAIRNANDMITAAETQKLPAYVAAGLIFNAYHMATITELWIEAPYTRAGQGRGDVAPAYDSQETIYKAVLSNLERANTLLDNTTRFTLGGDVLYRGDVLKWKKLANSLRLRYLLRLSNRPEINAAQEIKKIVDDPTTYPIITSNAEAGIYNFSGVLPDASVLSTVLPTSLGGVSPSRRMVNLLQPNNDPRINFFFVKPRNSTGFPNHEGVISGTTREAAQSTNGNGDENASSLTRRFVEDRGLLDYTIISYSEVQFILAEARLKGWITTGTAQEYYERGITANFDYWRINMPTGFLQGPLVAWNNTLERLMDQKWLAFYLNNTVEAWGEYKRTGLPALTPGPLATTITNGQIPTRVFYPTLEQSVNAANYTAATVRIGGDIITAKHWYQN